MNLSQKITGTKDESIDLEKATLQRMWDYISGRIEKKSPAKQAEFYKKMLNDTISTMQDVPSGEAKLRELFKSFKSEF